MTTTKDEALVIDHVIGDHGRLAVSLASAEIRLAAIDGERVLVRTPDGRTLPDGIVVEATDRALTIREASNGLAAGRRLVQLEIRVPARSEVAIATASGWLDGVGLLGEQHYRTVSGETRLRDVAGTIELTTVSGDAVVDLSGPTTLALKSVSGDATIRGGRLDALRVGSTSGDIRIDSPLAGAAENAIETLSGDVELMASGGLRVEARTVSGDISTKLPHRNEGRMGRRTLIVGDGSIELAFRSVSGDLRILDGSASVPIPPAPPAAPEPPFSSDLDLAEFARSDLDRPDGAPTDAAGRSATAVDPFETERMTILRALERGELDVATAMDRLGSLDEAPKPDPEHRR